MLKEMNNEWDHASPSQVYNIFLSGQTGLQMKLFGSLKQGLSLDDRLNFFNRADLKHRNLTVELQQTAGSRTGSALHL